MRHTFRRASGFRRRHEFIGYFRQREALIVTSTATTTPLRAASAPHISCYASEPRRSIDSAPRWYRMQVRRRSVTTPRQTDEHDTHIADFDTRRSDFLRPPPMRARGL